MLCILARKVESVNCVSFYEFMGEKRERASILVSVATLLFFTYYSFELLISPEPYL